MKHIFTKTAYPQQRLLNAVNISLVAAVQLKSSTETSQYQSDHIILVSVAMMLVLLWMQDGRIYVVLP